MTELVVLLGEPNRVVARMPTCERYRRLLLPQVTYQLDRNGESIEHIDNTIKVPRDKPIPFRACHDIIEEVDRASVCATPPMANRLSKLLMAFYPRARSENPEVYAQGITSVFAGYPPDIGFAAIDNITRRLPYLPTRADINEECATLMGQRWHAKRVAERHLEEHERIAAALRVERAQKLEWTKRCAQYPHLLIYNRWENRFRQNICVWLWLSALKGWVDEYGEEEVEAWHHEIGVRSELPADIYSELLKMLRQAAPKHPSVAETDAAHHS